jgi:hypothetical protein
MKLIIRSVILVVLMIACVWMGLFYPPFWQPENARDTLPRGANMAVLLFFVVLILRAGFRWSVCELIISQLWSPFVTMFVIAHFFIGMTWSETFNDFSLKRLLTQVVFICLPCLLGVLIGSLLLKCRDKFSIFPTDKPNN